MQLLFAFNQRPPLVLFAPPQFPFPRLMWAIAPHHLCSLLRGGVVKMGLFFGMGGAGKWGCRCC